MRDYDELFNLKWGKDDWTLIFTQKNSEKDISNLDDEQLKTIKRVREALSKDELFSIFELTMADTKNLLSILSEIEICSSWNRLESRDTDEIVRSLIWMLCNHETYDTNGVKIGE